MFVVRATRDFGWLCERTGSCLTPRVRGIECVNETTGAIVGQVAYDQWTENACMAHVAVDVALAWRRLLGPAFEYPFVEAKRGLILTSVNSTNARSLRLMGKLGFLKTHTIRDAVSVGEHLVLFEMRREDCRFLG